MRLPPDREAAEKLRPLAQERIRSGELPSADDDAAP